MGTVYQIIFTDHEYTCVNDVHDVKLDGGFIILVGDVGQTLAVVSPENLQLVKRLGR